MFFQIVNMVLGAALLVSAFAWRHSHAQRLNDLICGALIMVIAGLSSYAPNVRRLTAPIGLWLLFSGLAIEPATMGGWYMKLLVGAAVFLLAVTTPEERTFEVFRRHAG